MKKDPILLSTTEQETIISNPNIELFSELGILTKKEDINKLILWNDDVNSFDHVISSLIEICKLSVEKSVELAVSAHKNGKTVIKKGKKDDLLIFKQGLNDRGIEATIE